MGVLSRHHSNDTIESTQDLINLIKWYCQILISISGAPASWR